MKRLALLLLLVSPVFTFGADPVPAVVYDGKPLGDWLKQLRSDDRVQRETALKNLHEVAKQEKAAVRAIVDAFVALPIDAETRDLTVVDAFGPLLYEIGKPAAEALHPHLWSKDKNVVFRALLGVALMGHRGIAAAPGVIEIAEKSEDENLVKMAFLAMDRAKDLIYLPALTRLLQGDDLTRRDRALQLLHRGGYPADVYVGNVMKWLNKGLDDSVIGLTVLNSVGRAATPALKEVIECLKNGNMEQKLLAIEVIRQLGMNGRDALPVVRPLVESDDNVFAMLAAMALLALGDEATALPILTKLAPKADPVVKLNAARALWIAGREKLAITLCKQLITSDDDETSADAIRMATGFGPRGKELAETLITQLESKSLTLQGLAARALGAIGPAAGKEAVAKLAATLKAEDPVARITAASALARIDTAAQSGAFTELLASPDFLLRCEAAMELGRPGSNANASAKQSLQRMMESKDPKDHVLALATIWHISQDPTVLPALVKLLGDPKADQMGAAAEIGAIFGTNAESAVPALIMALWDANVSSTAAEAIGRVGPGAKAAVPALVRLIQLPDHHVGVYSAGAEALGLIGKDAADAIPALQVLLKHFDALTRVHAALALRKITGKDHGDKVIEESLISNRYAVYITALEAKWLAKQDPAIVKLLIRELRAATLSNEELASNRAYMAVRALGRCGLAAKEALDDLRDLAFNDNPELVRQSAIAIKLIEMKK